MINVNNSIRFTQNINKKFPIGDFLAYNSKTGIETVINCACYLFLNKINDGIIENEQELVRLAKKNSFKYEEMIKLLYDNDLIVSSNIKHKNENMLKPLNLKFPLTALSLEITQNCNLKCRHCYGQFGKDCQSNQLTLDYIKSLKPSLDKLHTKSIALTGGSFNTQKF